MRKLIAFDDETMTALTQLGHDRMATLQDLADEAFADLFEKARPADRPQGRSAQECGRQEEENMISESHPFPHYTRSRWNQRRALAKTEHLSQQA